ncbi:MAG: hypothetical protein R3F55_26030, partial [Alphaproteobacteria bacterium]
MTAGRKKRRWWLWILGGIGGLLLVLVGGAVFVLDRYAGDIVRQALTDAALPNPRLDIEHIGLSSSRMVDIRIGDADELVADAVELEYDLFDLIGLSPEDLTIRLTRPTIHLSVDENGAVSLGSLDALLGGAGAPGDETGPATTPSGGAAAAPFDRLVLDDATVVLDTPDGSLTAHASGTIDSESDGGFAIDLALKADNETAVLDADVTATVGPTGAIDGQATLRALTARTPWGDAEDGTGTVAVAWPGEGLPTGTADLAFASLRIPGALLPPALSTADGDMTLHDVAVAASFDGTALAARVAAADTTGENALSVEIDTPDLFAGGSATVAVDLASAGDTLLWPLRTDWTGGGSLTASATGTVTVPPIAALAADPAAAMAEAEGKLTLQWLLGEATVPGLGQDIASVGDVTVTLAEGRATLASDDPVELRIGALDPAALAGLAESDPQWEPILARDFAGRIDLAVEGRPTRSLTLTLAGTADGWTAEGDMTVLAATESGPLVAAEFTGTVHSGEDVTVELTELSLYASDIDP